jgi:hypothetical protein
MNRVDAVGYLASVLVFAAFCMKEMIPLRVVAICSNIAFLTYGPGTGPHPNMAPARDPAADKLLASLAGVLPKICRRAAIFDLHS